MPVARAAASSDCLLGHILDPGSASHGVPFPFPFPFPHPLTWQTHYSPPQQPEPQYAAPVQPSHPQVLVTLFTQPYCYFCFAPLPQQLLLSCGTLSTFQLRIYAFPVSGEETRNFDTKRCTLCRKYYCKPTTNSRMTGARTWEGTLPALVASPFLSPLSISIPVSIPAIHCPSAPTSVCSAIPS